MISNAQIERMDMAAAWERQCHAMSYPCDEDGVLSISEEAAERAALAAVEAAGICGLVSVPTTGKGASAYRVGQASARLRAVLPGQSQDQSPEVRSAGRIVKKRLPRCLGVTETDKARARMARMRRSVGFSARALLAGTQQPGFRGDYCAMVTLTYRNTEDWRPDHIKAALQNMRKQLQRWGQQGARYVWVAELQKRGAMHYHVAVWLPHGWQLPKFDEAGWWPHGATNVKAAQKPIAYLMKYMQKGGSVAFPKGARTHGVGGVEHAMRRAKRWLSYPGWVKARADVHDDWRPAAGGGWADPDGVVIPSEHVRAWLGDRWGALRVADYGRPFDAAGPFEWLNRGRA